ncbi:MAG: HEWD family protein [Halorhabdus sp.]
MIQIEPPAERTCERCGRNEVWDDEAEVWRSPDETDAGRAHCLHEWDINGAYNPVVEE